MFKDHWVKFQTRKKNVATCYPQKSPPRACMWEAIKYFSIIAKKMVVSFGSVELECLSHVLYVTVLWPGQVTESESQFPLPWDLGSLTEWLSQHVKLFRPRQACSKRLIKRDSTTVVVVHSDMDFRVWAPFYNFKQKETLLLSFFWLLFCEREGRKLNVVTPLLYGSTYSFLVPAIIINWVA